MIQASKIIGTGLATTGLIGAGVENTSSFCVKTQNNKLTLNGESLENKDNTVDKKYSEAFLAWKVFLNISNRVKLRGTLKLFILSRGWKIMSGWINYFMVRNYKTSEKRIDNHGSKSNFISKSVKEQWVYGNLLYLRINLFQFYIWAVKNFFKQLNIILFYTCSKLLKNNYITNKDQQNINTDNDPQNDKNQRNNNTDEDPLNNNNQEKDNIIPVAVYSDAYLNKSIILKDNKNKSGIYRWVNKVNGKSYVGSSVNLSLRLKVYYDFSFLSARVANAKSKIYSAILKHGYSSFQLEILEYCTKENAISREQYYLDLLNPEYNILKIAGSRLGSKHSEETLLKMSGKNNPMFGKNHSEETIVKISSARKGKSHSKETRKKMSDAKKGFVRAEGAGRPTQKIEVFDIENNVTTIYDSIHEAARALNIKHSVISTYFKNDQKKAYKGRYIFKKIV